MDASRDSIGVLPNNEISRPSLNVPGDRSTVDSIADEVKCQSTTKKVEEKSINSTKSLYDSIQSAVEKAMESKRDIFDAKLESLVEMEFNRLYEQRDQTPLSQEPLVQLLDDRATEMLVSNIDLDVVDSKQILQSISEQDRKHLNDLVEPAIATRILFHRSPYSP